MKSESKKPASIDEFIAPFPTEVRNILEEVRQTIHLAAPQAEEAIKYGIPTFILHGNLVHFSAYKDHIGFYPSPGGMAAFEKELARYETGKGSIRFPLDQPIPYDLIRRIVLQRVSENMARFNLRAKKK